MSNKTQLYKMTFLLRSNGYLIGKIVLKSKRTSGETAKKLLAVSQKLALKHGFIYPTSANFVLNA